MTKPKKQVLNILLSSIAACSLFPVPAQGQFVPQVSIQVGAAGVGASYRCASVALSGNGNTAIVGGCDDTSYTGAAWVFTRSGGIWSQQGSKLVGTGAVGPAYQGKSVALSGDGNTAIVGGEADNNYAGAAWVFTQNAGVWSQQGAKLVGTGAVGNAYQGESVALSEDGNTAIVGGSIDNGNTGAAWVFTRNTGVWTQQGSKLVGTGSVGIALQGISVALSGDGNTAIIGGTADSSGTGAAWVFTRNAEVWTQQGTKLVGTGATGIADQGVSVALSGDGNTAIVGGGSDNNGSGAAWVFARSAGVWTQQGSKLVGTGTVGAAFQGTSVALSETGNAALVGGPDDNTNTGASWVFTRNAGAWTQQGSKLVGTGATGAAEQGTSVALSADGNTALIGSPYGDNNNYATAAWVFTQPYFFAGEVFQGGAVYDLTLPNGRPFGYYAYLDDLWIYHFDMGYLYAHPGNGPEVYLWDLASGHWWYTNNSTFPYLYDFTLNAWLYYFPNTKNPGHYLTNPRVFVNMTTGVFFTM
jgi:hypothetical protein